jgi:pyrroline-5-carboxylate reductase
MMENRYKLSMIGAGNMAEAILAGIVSKQLYKQEQICATNKSNKERLNYFSESFGIHTTEDVKEALSTEIVILAMKPKDVAAGLDLLKSHITRDHLIISVAAGITAESIEALVNLEVPVIRAMPNTSAAIGQSATALSKGQYANDEHLEKAVSLFKTIGSAVVVDESQMHAVTGVSGSGPAYYYYLVEAMERAALELGLEKDVAKNLVVQTIIGAGEMLKQSPKDPSTLKKDVMSPGGTTEAGLKVLEYHDVQKAMIECIKQAASRSEEIGTELANMMVKQK